MKRTPATSGEYAVQAMVDAASGPPPVPEHVRLRPGDLPFWHGIVRARAYGEWSAVDLVVAAQLARAQADIESESHLLDAEGSVVKNERGTVVANARVSVLEQLARREMALMRSLRMAGPQAGDARNESGRRKAQRQAAAVLDEIAGEDLLAT